MDHLAIQTQIEVSDSIDAHLFGGCCLEAQRSDIVARHLAGLRGSLAGSADRHLCEVMDEVRAGGRFLRELADLSQVHQDRVPPILNHLNIVLPCLSKSLRDMSAYCENGSLSKGDRWRIMVHDMMDESGGSTLAQRFTMYNYFLTSLRDILIRYNPLSLHI